MGYYTHYQDPDFKLLQLGVRFYDSDTGRFTQRDPAEDGLNWYEYVSGNPIILSDPEGLAGKNTGSVFDYTGGKPILFINDPLRIKNGGWEIDPTPGYSNPPEFVGTVIFHRWYRVSWRMFGGYGKGMGELRCECKWEAQTGVGKRYKDSQRWRKKICNTDHYEYDIRWVFWTEKPKSWTRNIQNGYSVTLGRVYWHTGKGHMECACPQPSGKP